MHEKGSIIKGKIMEKVWWYAVKNVLEFLLKEIPSHAEEMISSLKISIEQINFTRVLLRNKAIKLQDHDKLDEAMEYIQANKELFGLEKNLKEFLGDIDTLMKNNDRLLMKTNSSLQDVGQLSTEQMMTKETMQIEDDNEEEIIDDEFIESKVDYHKYMVDNTIPYPLSKDLENTTPYSFSFMGKTYRANTYLQIWLKLCELLYNRDKQIFENIAANHIIAGKKKAYIVYKGDEIAKNNKKPVNFLNTNIVLETNTSTVQKVSIMQKMLSVYKISESAVKIYLENDRRPRHNQQPIGKYLNSDCNYTKEPNLKGVIPEIKPEIKVSRIAYNYFEQYFRDTSQYYDIQNFLDVEWCTENLGISCPLLKPIDIKKDIKEQTNYGDKNYPSYAQNPKLLINGKTYIICMRWYEAYRSKLEKWISEHEIIEIKQKEKQRDKSNCIYYDFKKNLCSSLDNPLFNQPCDHVNSCKYYLEQEIYLASKEEMKDRFCPCCGIKTKNMNLEVAYIPNGVPARAITHRLLTLRCDYCNKNFMNIDVFKMYTRNKNLDDIGAKFIQFRGKV